VNTVEGPVGAGAHGLERVNREQARVGDELDVDLPQRPLDRPLARPCERRDVDRDMNRVGSHFPRQRHQLGLGPSVAHEQAAAAAAQPLIQLAQALKHELGARSGGMAALQQPVVEAEDGDHLIVGAGRLERGMVVQAQIPSQPQDRRHGSEGAAGRLTAGRRPART
jgi:hypothetical protein